MRYALPVRVTALLAGVFATVPAVHAAESEPSQARSKPLDVVTIIGSRTDPSDVPGSAAVVDREALAQFVDADILRVLRTVPGVYLQEEEGFGLRPNIGIRGSGLDRSARIALLEDGVLIAPAPYAASSAYYFPTQRRMSAVEVLKGPAAVAVGPRTTGGAINLISTPIPDALVASADLRIGDDAAFDAHVSAGDRGQRISWLLETVQSGSDGFKRIDAPDAGDTGFELRDYVAKLELDSDPASRVYQSLRVKLGFTEQDADETYLGLTADDFAIDPYRRYAASANDRFTSEHRQAQASYVIDPDSFWRAELTAYRNDFERNWYKLQSVGGESLATVLNDPTAFANEYAILTGTTSADDALAIRANNRSYFSQGLQGRVVWEADFANADVIINTGFRVHEDEEDRFQHQDGYRMVDGRLELTTAAAPGSQSNRVSTADVYALFADAEFRAGSWIVTPGLRYEHIDLERLDFSTADPTRAAGPTRVRRNGESVLIPGIGALYRLDESWRLLAGVHRGYNPPAPGSSADAETSLNVEAGARYERGPVSAEAIYFVNDYDNLVGTVTESTGGGVIGDQFDGGEAVVHGLELALSGRIDRGALTVPLDLRYTWTRDAEFDNAFESDFDPWGDVAAGDELPYIPEHQLRATAGIETARLGVNLAANYVGERRTVAGQDAIDASNGIDSYWTFDLLGRWSLTPSLSVYAKVDNLFDENYVAAARPAGLRPGQPRTAYLGVQFSL